MLTRIKEVLQAYIDRNEKSYARMMEEQNPKYEDLVKIEASLLQELNDSTTSPLAVLVLHNNDLTPMGYVYQVIENGLKIPEVRAHEIVQRAHAAGRCQVLAGKRELLERISDTIQRDAHSRGFPLKFTVEEC